MQADRKNEYEALLQEKLNRIKEIHPLDPKNNWEFSHEKFDVKIHTKKDKSKGINIVRGEGVINAPIAKIIEEIHKVDDYSIWDRTLDTSKHIETIDEYVIMHAKVRKTPAITTRETVAVKSV